MIPAGIALLFKSGYLKALGMLGVGLTVSLLSWLAWNHYTGLLANNTQLTSKLNEQTQKAARVQTEYDAYKTRITTLIAEERGAHAKLQTTYATARTENRNLHETLAKHDFGHLAFMRPGLVQSVVNRATLRVFNTLQTFPTGTHPHQPSGPPEPGRDGVTENRVGGVREVESGTGLHPTQH